MVSFGSLALSSSARDNQAQIDVAIKKVHNVFQKPILAKRALREIKLLRHFAGHENVPFFNLDYLYLGYASRRFFRL